MTEQVPRITKEEVRERMNELTILDVRSEKDWSRSDRKISGAHRETPGEENRWMEKYPKGQPYVLYCAWDQENTSAGSAQKLIDAGYSGVYALKGGWKEWREAGYPVEEK